MHNRSARGFTLVEMLVVIGIIAVLAALLLPAINRVLISGRNAAIGVEVNQLATAIESYKQDKGDYPPNFRDANVVLRHIRKCYPKVNPQHLGVFMTQVFPPNGLTNPTANNPVIDESEALVFWLAMIDTDPQYPFLSLPLVDPNTSALYSAVRAPAPKKYYDFDETRLISSTQDGIPSYVAKYCQDSFYIYIDSRSYFDTCLFSNPGPDAIKTFAFADANNNAGVRPYWSNSTTGVTNGLFRGRFKPVNPSTFQIICAGQDGDFGDVQNVVDIKQFPSGDNYETEDKDNLANFSGGKTLGDSVP